MKDYRDRVANKGNPDKLNTHEIEVLAMQYAKMEVSREKKHLKAYLKGERMYKSFGRTYPVLTPEVFEEQRQLDLKAEETQEEE